MGAVVALGSRRTAKRGPAKRKSTVAARSTEDDRQGPAGGLPELVALAEQLLRQPEPQQVAVLVQRLQAFAAGELRPRCGAFSPSCQGLREGCRCRRVAAGWCREAASLGGRRCRIASVDLQRQPAAGRGRGCCQLFTEEGFSGAPKTDKPLHWYLLRLSDVSKNVSDVVPTRTSMRGELGPTGYLRLPGMRSADMQKSWPTCRVGCPRCKKLCGRCLRSAARDAKNLVADVCGCCPRCQNLAADVCGRLPEMQKLGGRCLRSAA